RTPPADVPRSRPPSTVTVSEPATATIDAAPINAATQTSTLIAPPDSEPLAPGPETNHPARAVARRERIERVVDPIQRVGARHEFLQLQSPVLIQRHQPWDVARRVAGSVHRSDQPLFLHYERKHRNQSLAVDARQAGEHDGAAFARAGNCGGQRRRP